jgi:7-cyano-7-deazaguanine synthase
MKAVVLLSGGVDSTTALAFARDKGFDCFPLCVSYEQRHWCEIDAAKRVAKSMGLDVSIVSAPALGKLAKSALTADIDVPKDRSPVDISSGIPATYVPARNTVFLGLALAYAESIGARDIFTGFNVLDASGYPDCRPEFVQAFENLAQVATAPGPKWSLHTPLISLTKAQIIALGVSLSVDYSLTHSCYDPKHGGLSCGRCDSCQLRQKGFIEAGVVDPTRYA